MNTILFQKMFSIKNIDNHKVIFLFGLKIKIRRYSENIILLRQIFQELAAIRTCIYASQVNKPLEKFKNIFDGKTVAIVATGPSLEKFKPFDDVIYIGVNRAIYNKIIDFNYIFVQDYTINQNEKSPCPKGYENLNTDINNYNKNNVIKFYGILPPKRLKDVYPWILGIPQSFGYQENVYRYVVEDKLFNIWAADIANMPFGDWGGTVFSALQFALYANPKKILLVGCDCSGKYNKEQIEQWKSFKEFAKCNNPNLEINSVNPVGLKGMFNDIYQY